jgi:Cys-tRNA(Pro) deacylase
MGLQRVKNFISKYPEIKIVLFASSTHTAELAAQAVGVTPAQIAKTLVFLADGRPVVVVTCGDKKVDTKRLAKVLAVKKIRFADAATVLASTGFTPGGISPFGLPADLPLYLDLSLYDYPVVYAAAGTANSAVPISPEQIGEMAGATVIDVC